MISDRVSQRLGRGLKCAHFAERAGTFGVGDDPNAMQAGNDLTQKFDLLAAIIGALGRKAREGAAGPREAKSRGTQSVIPSRLASPTTPLLLSGSCTCQTHGRGCRARISRPATSGLKFLDRGSEGRNRRERFALVCAGSRMEWLQARPRV